LAGAGSRASSATSLDAPPATRRPYDGAIHSPRERDDAGLQRVETRSLSGRVRDELLRAIRSDAFPAGRLPPESELAAQLGVSRTTIRAALQSLADDGIVSRRRRHGTVVNDHLLRTSMLLNRMVSFRSLIAQAGHEPSVDPQVHRRQGADAEAAEALEVEPGEASLVVRRLLRAGGEPVITITDTVPLERLQDPDAVVDADSTFEFLASNGVGTVDYARAEIVPCVATRGRPRELDIAPGSPYVELRETLFSRDHERLAFSRIEVDDTLVRFSLLRRDF
jgi:GntR family transcriptional regulator